MRTITKAQYEKAITESDAIISRLILDNDYEGLLDQDGFETTELTVKGNHGSQIAELILGKLSFYEANKTVIRSAQQ